jgi:hypothetical protein
LGQPALYAVTVAEVKRYVRASFFLSTKRAAP